MLKFIFIFSLLVSVTAEAQVSSLQFNYAAVELTNCYYPIIRSTNSTDWTECGFVVPIPAQPRDAWCFYRVGADWNTNFPVWITPTNVVYIWHTNTLAQIPRVVWVTQDVVYHKLLTKTATSAKIPKVVSQPVMYKTLPSLP